MARHIARSNSTIDSFSRNIRSCVHLQTFKGNDYHIFVVHRLKFSEFTHVSHLFMNLYTLWTKQNKQTER